MPLDYEDELARVTKMGHANQEVIRLATLWCAHLKTALVGGRGMFEAQSGLPIDMRQFRCDFATSQGLAGMNLEPLAIKFYDDNCATCKDRSPVGFPNISQLIEKRDKQAEDRTKQYKEQQNAFDQALSARAARRDSRAASLNPRMRAIIDVIDKLDRAPNDESEAALLELFKTVPHLFERAAYESLIELAEAGGQPRATAALQVLDQLPFRNPAEVVACALKVLGQGDPSDLPGRIVAKGLNLEHRPLIPSALKEMIYRASDERPSFVFETSKPLSDPAPLQTTYNLFPDLVISAFAEQLKSPEKWHRILTCSAINTLLEQDPKLILALGEPLLTSTSLPDDPYDYGTASSAIAKTFALGIAIAPTPVDNFLQSAYNRGNAKEKAVIVDSYIELFPWRPKDTEANEAQRISFQRLIEVLVAIPSDERLQQVGLFMRDRAPRYVGLIADHIDKFIGAAALISTAMDNLQSSPLDTRPTPMKGMELALQATYLDVAYSGSISALAEVASTFPLKIAPQLTDILKGLPSKQDRLKASLVELLGSIGETQPGLQLSLPGIYTGMLDKSPRVRSSGIEAYSRLARESSDDLPKLMHETFIVLLNDQFIGVHAAAVEVVIGVGLPKPYTLEILKGLTNLVNAHSVAKTHDSVLARCIEAHISTLTKVRPLKPTDIAAYLGILKEMAPNAAFDLLTGYSEHFSLEPSYTDLLIAHLLDARTYDFHLDDLVELLSSQPPAEIVRVAPGIVKAAELCAKRGKPMPEEFIELLTSSGAWKDATLVAHYETSRFKSTKWDREAKLFRDFLYAATNLEYSIAQADKGLLKSALDSWNSVAAQLGQRNAE
jgi:hypothetical protein